MSTEPYLDHLVITYQNVYTKRVFTACDAHANVGGDVQIQHGAHEGTCDFCEAETSPPVKQP